jgi:hypothetical protein
MAKPDVFALAKTGMNGFLFACVGIDFNGSPLTVLSTLARLGDDPWLKAASWERMSRAAARANLAASIGVMPLRPEDLDAASATAERLIDLLFDPVRAESFTARSPTGLTLKPMPVVVICLMIGLVFVFALAAAQQVFGVGPSSAEPGPVVPSLTDTVH